MNVSIADVGHGAEPSRSQLNIHLWHSLANSIVDALGVHSGMYFSINAVESFLSIVFSFISPVIDSRSHYSVELMKVEAIFLGSILLYSLHSISRGTE